jgi:hypothetical protein
VHENSYWKSRAMTTGRCGRSANATIGFDKASGRTETRTIGAKKSIPSAAAPRFGRTWNLGTAQKQLPGYARRSRLAGGQNSCAIKGEVIFARSLGPLAEAFGGGELGRDIAAHILEVQKGLPAGTLGRKSVDRQSKPPSVGPNPSESDLIRPNQT